MLYQKPTSLSEKLIVWATHGIYYHCEIALDDLRTVGAHKDGIRLGTIPVRDPDKYTLVPLPTGADIEAGLAWAKQQIGKEYGWLDIAFQAVKFLFPNNPFQLTQRNRWDCSDFCTRYLMECDVNLPEEYLDPYQNTPNDLARALGVIEERAGVVQKREAAVSTEKNATG